MATVVDKILSDFQNLPQTTHDAQVETYRRLVNERCPYTHARTDSKARFILLYLVDEFEKSTPEDRATIEGLLDGVLKALKT